LGNNCVAFIFDKIRYELNGVEIDRNRNIGDWNMKGKRFATVEEVKQKSLEGLKDIPMSEFKNCFEQWKNRLEKCVVVNGEYFEGD
ncbi:hypothetical protein ALC56_09112, partial [Trachymyrmex septentrionalis]